MFDSLSFNVSTTICESECNQKYIRFGVRPVINGTPLVERGYVFDIAEILAREDSSGELDIFTCSCGHAGCVGIDDVCSITSTPESIIWTFPNDPFAKSIDPFLRKGRDVLRFVFERNHYFATLKTLVDSMIVEEELNSLPIHYHASEVYMMIEVAQSVSERLVEDKVHVKARFERERKRKECFGKFANSSVKIALGQGIVLEIGVENLLRHKASDDGYAGEQEDAYITSTLVANASANDAYLADLVKSMSWERVWEISWVRNGGTETSEASIEALMPFLYPNAVISCEAASE